MVDAVASHLLPEVRLLLRLEAKERIQYIQKDNWIGYSRAKQALKKLKSLYNHPRMHRMPNLLIIGATNNGKTMVVEKFCRDNPPILLKQTRSNPIGGNSKILRELPILSMQMLPTPDPKRFYRSIIDVIFSLGGGGDSFCHASPLEREIIPIFQKFKVKMLIIDEIHNMLSGRNDKQREFLNALRYLGNALQIPIVCIGTKDAYLAIRSDPQLENRFEPFLLPAWSDGEEYQSLLASIVAILPLKKQSDLTNPLVSQFILEKTGGVLGEIFTFVRRAAIMAIETKREVIDLKILKMVDYHSPAERIQLFERSLVSM